jgi:hypothetical protein
MLPLIQSFDELELQYAWRLQVPFAFSFYVATFGIIIFIQNFFMPTPLFYKFVIFLALRYIRESTLGSVM